MSDKVPRIPILPSADELKQQAEQSRRAQQAWRERVQEGWREDRRAREQREHERAMHKEALAENRRMAAASEAAAKASAEAARWAKWAALGTLAATLVMFSTAVAQCASTPPPSVVGDENAQRGGADVMQRPVGPQLPTGH